MDPGKLLRLGEPWLRSHVRFTADYLAKGAFQ
jgi:hypothetical protein